MSPGGDKPGEGFPGDISVRERDQTNGNIREGWDDGTCSEAEMNDMVPAEHKPSNPPLQQAPGVAPVRHEVHAHPFQHKQP